MIYHEDGSEVIGPPKGKNIRGHRANKKIGYLGNPKVKRAHVNIKMSSDEVEEWIKCAEDPVYFLRAYMKIVNIDGGLIPFNMYDFQEDLIRHYHQNRFSIVLQSRQTGKSITTAGFILWYVLFHSHKNVGVLANKGRSAARILARIKLAYERLPMWLQQGVVTWNKGDIELENGSIIGTFAASSDSARGESFALLFVDECAFVAPNDWEEYYKSSYPTISSGKTSKIMLVSTANGLNHFHSLYQSATRGKNTYKPFEVRWDMVPGRDEQWKNETISNTSLEEFEQEHCVGGETLVETQYGPMPIETLYNMMDDPKNKTEYCMERVIRRNSAKLKINTPNGMSDFAGVKRIKAETYYKVSFSNGTNIDCTTTHKFKTLNGFKQAKDLELTDIILGKDFNTSVNNIILIKESKYFYDLVDVEKEQEYYTNDIISHNCNIFLGGQNTLIDSYYLRNMVSEDPIDKKEKLQIFKYPEEKKEYFLTLDVSRGVGADYSALSIIDITEYPYEQVAIWRDNKTSTLTLPSIVEKIAKYYNTAWVLIETNDLGEAVAQTLNWDHEYEKLITTKYKNERKSRIGIRVDVKTKKVGCNRLKDMIESDQLLVKDNITINEFYQFQQKGNGYEAYIGNDDLVMGLVNFAYYASSTSFRNLFNTAFGDRFTSLSDEELFEDLCPAPIIDDGPTESSQLSMEDYRGLVS